MTADISSNEAAQPDTASDGAGLVRNYVLVAAVLFVVGLILATIGVYQLVLPDLLSGSAYTTYGRLAPAGRTLLSAGWITLAGLGLTLHVLARITGKGIKHRALATAALILITVGAIAGAGGLLNGMSSGIPGQESAVWARGISTIGYLLAAISITATARQRADRLGAAGWYLVGATWWLTVSALIGLIPLVAGVPGSIQAAFASAGMNRLFVMSMAVGLLYYAVSRISGADLTEPRPLAALGFWSLAFTWAFMGGVPLIYSASPDWYETLTIALAIGTLVPVVVIFADISLLIRGRLSDIGDRATLRYAVVAGLALVAATTVNFLLAWRATSAVTQYTTWAIGLDMLIVLGAGTFAIFAANSVRRGGSASEASLHLDWSVIGLVGATIGLFTGGIVSGFSWIAGPSSLLFSNHGSDYEIAIASLEPFLWITAVSMLSFTLAQFVYLVRINVSADEAPEPPEIALDLDLQFEGTIRYVTWRRLVWGAAAVWLTAAVFTAVLPMMDTTDTAPTLTADRFRAYSSGSSEQVGYELFISEGCTECHTQSVRPIVTDVGLGAVSVAGDYAHQSPALMTATRFGPDLMRVASREGFDAALIRTHLFDPRANRPWSIMPSYSYLSDADIDTIVSYIETLR